MEMKKKCVYPYMCKYMHLNVFYPLSTGNKLFVNKDYVKKKKTLTVWKCFVDDRQRGIFLEQCSGEDPPDTLRLDSSFCFQAWWGQEL